MLAFFFLSLPILLKDYNNNYYYYPSGFSYSGSSFRPYNSHIVKVPEETSGIVEDFCLRGILLDNSSIP